MFNKPLLSLSIIAASLGLTYVPLPGGQQTVVVVSGTELQEPLTVLAEKFEESQPQIEIELEFQGSQDIVNNYLNGNNDFTPTVLIPANETLLEELEERSLAQGGEPFYDQPQAIAKTMLVGIAWSERGKVLFPNGFEWERLEEAMAQRNWKVIGGKDWGSFDFIMTDPTRSNSGQLTLSLWARSQLKENLNSTNLNTPAVESLFSLIKRSVYQPPRSTDILLQEFIARGSNNADVGTVYESIALSRWNQANATAEQPYQIYYLNPTIETVATAAIVRQGVEERTAQAAREFVEFLREPEQQEVFVQYGFRPIEASLDLQSVANSLWNQNIPGAEVNPAVEIIQPPNTEIIGEIQRLWERSQ